MSVRERDCREWGRGVWPEQVGVLLGGWVGVLLTEKGTCGEEDVLKRRFR